MLITSMEMLAHLVTTGTPDAAYAIPLVLYAGCLAPLLSAVGRGTVSRLAQASQLDAVSIYMTARQLGAALGVAFVTLLLDRRETLHSSRLFDSLRDDRPAVHDWLASALQVMVARGGSTPAAAHAKAVAALDALGSQQAATLAYADAFSFMAAIGVVTLCLVPLMPPKAKAKS